MYKTKTRSLSLILYQINSKRVKDLHIRHETLKELKEVLRNPLKHVGIGNYFLKKNSNSSASKRKNEQIRMNNKLCCAKFLHNKRNSYSLELRDC
jgi:hypothetical protein